MKKKSSGFRHLSFAAFGAPTPFDPSFSLVTSSLPFLPPVALAAVRALLAIYTLLTAIIILGLEAAVYGGGNSYLSYFTSLSYIGLCSYFCASSVQNIAFAYSLSDLRGVQDDRDTHGRETAVVERKIGYPLQRWPRVLQVLHVLLYTSIVVYPFIVTIVFWALLSGSQTFSTPYNAWSNMSRHILNSVFAFFEITCTNVSPPPWSHLVPVFIPLACYLGVAYITHAKQGFYTYSFLDPGTHPGRVAAYVVGIAVGYCIVFAIVKGLITLRCRLTGRYWGSRNEEGQGEPEALDEWEEVQYPQQQSAPRL